MMHARAARLSDAASSGAKFTMLGQLARVGIQALSVVVLSRMLDPSSFGLLAMVIAIVGVGELFRDFGLSQAAVQARDLSPTQQSNLFWLNSGIGALLGVACFGASWAVAGLYGDPRLVEITQVVSLTFLLNGLATQYRAQLMRQLRFLTLAANEVAGQFAGFVAAVAVAALTGSYWALAVQQIVTAAISLIMLVVTTRWFPGLYRRDVRMTSFLKFGGFLVLAQVVTYISRNVDSVIIGVRLGAADLGFYNRAFQLLLVPLNQINAPATRVALPVLSKLQNERERFDRYVVAAQSMILQPIVAAFALVAAIAPFAVPLALGPGWDRTIPLFQILAIAGCLQAASSASYWVFLARGATKSQLYWALIARPFVIVAVVVGAIWGVEGVAWGFTIGNALVWPFSVWWIARFLDAPGRAMILNGVRALGVYGIAGLATSAAFTALTAAAGWQPIAGALVGIVVFGAIVAGAVIAIPSFRADVVQLKHLAGRRRRR